MEELVRYIVTALVTHPDAVEITSQDDPDGVKLIVQVRAEDAGLVIGKRGYVIRAIRQLANVIASRQNKRVYVEVNPIEG